jgi:ABC-type sugar transport system substrate-binding protein
MIVGHEHRLPRHRHRHFALVTGAVTVLAALAACSSTSSSTSSSAAAATSAVSGTSSCVTAADTYLQPWDSLPTALSSAYTPLSVKPSPGGTVIKLVDGAIPSDNQSYQQMAIAARTIGWSAKEIVFNGTVEDLNAKFEQAISERPTAITVDGWPVAALQRPLADAKAAGIVVGLAAVPDLATSYPGYASNTNGAVTARQIGELNAYMFMRASGCKGSAAIFSLPFPILKISTDAFQATVKAHCPACAVSYNELQASDIGTPAVSNAVVSELQASPGTKYVYTIIGNVADGLAQALSQAGISGVKIFGQVPDEASIAALRDGTNAWWIDQSSLINGWTELDGILRVLEAKQPISDHGGYPLAILTPQNVPAGTGIPVLPSNYQSEFEQLWHAG